MPFFSKPAGALASLLVLLQLLTFAAAIRVDTHSCTGAYRMHVNQALDEVEAMVTYAEKRANAKSPYPRQGTLLQDLLDAGSENDPYVLRKVQATFNEVRSTLRNNKIVIHCNDKHLTKSTNTVYNDNSNGRQARVQVLSSAQRNPRLGACGGIQRAFAYPFYDAKTHKPAGEAIVLCSDTNVGALKAADLTKDVEFWRNKDLRSVGQGIDMFGRYLSYMILHELMHATDARSFPVNPGGQAEKYGYEEITGHKVGRTGHGGPSSLIRLANADSYALLACGWYMNAYKVENGKFVLTPKAQRPPVTLRRRSPVLDALEARDPKSKPKPKTSKKEDEPPTSTQAPAPSTQVPPATTQAPPASSKPITTPSATLSGTRTNSISTKSSSTSTWLPPLVTAIGDNAKKFPLLIPIAVAIVVLPDWDFGSGNGTTNGTAPISGTGGSGTGIAGPTGTGMPPFTSIPAGAGWNSTMLPVTVPAGTGTAVGVAGPTLKSGFITSIATPCSSSLTSLSTPCSTGFVTSVSTPCSSTSTSATTSCTTS